MMASVATGFRQLVVAAVILSHLSASLPSMQRQQRQIELKLMHDAGMRREYEKAAKLLQTLMDYKRSVPNTSGAKNEPDSLERDIGNSSHLEEKLLKLKTCLQNLAVSFPNREANDAAQRFSLSICQLIAELNEATSGVAIDGSQE